MKALYISFLLLFSWYLPMLHKAWEWMDRTTYLGLHNFFLGTLGQVEFWACMNSRLGDHISQLAFLSLFVLYIVKPMAQLTHRRRFFQVLLIIGLTISSVVLSKWLQHYVVVKRESPSLVYGHPVVALSEVLSNDFDNIKDSSHRSFPGDHAMTLILMCLLMHVLCRNALFTAIAWVVTVFFILPRLISGAHWLTDTVMGSFPIASVAFVISLLIIKRFFPKLTAA